MCGEASWMKGKKNAKRFAMAYTSLAGACAINAQHKQNWSK